MKKQIKQTVQPQLRKKNGVWVKVLVPALCIVAGAGAMAGLVYGVPAINNAFITNKDGSTITKPGGEVLDLKNQISELTTKLQNATSLADERGNKINELNSQIEQIKADSALSEEEKQEQIKSLTAQLNQAVVDKEQAEGLVAGLQAQIEALQAKIDQMEGNAIVDTLQLENFVGTWYKNGTFEDYFTIEGTTITRGANEDKGVIYKLYNQVYLGLNSMDNTACSLSENGTKITLADGTEYTKSFINTVENTSINMGIIAGEYSYSTEKIVLNGDNTASYFDGTNTYHGAFTATATEKNVGGNITLTHYITLTINKDSGQEIMEFSLVNYNNKIIDNDNKFWIKQLSVNPVELVGSYTSNINQIYKNDCYKITIKSRNILTIENNKHVALSLNAIYDSYFKDATSTYAYINGQNKSSSLSGYSSSVGLYNKSGETISSDMFTIYLKPTGKRGVQQGMYFTLIDGGRIGGEDFDIVNIEVVGDALENDSVKLSDELMRKFVNPTYYKTCSTISDYYTGSWSNEAVSVDLTSETAIVTPTGIEEPITATEYTVTAKTDGTNIIHSVIIKYTDAEEVEHTLTFDITNNSTTTTTALLDEEEIVLNKALKGQE